MCKMCVNFDKKKEKKKRRIWPVFLVTMQKIYLPQKITQKLPPNAPLFKRTPFFKHIVIAEITTEPRMLRLSCLGQMEQSDADWQNSKGIPLAQASRSQVIT